MALKAAETCLNQLTLSANEKTPLSKFSGIVCQIFIRNFHAWGCPVFVLDGHYQTNPKGVPKWEPQSQVGIYMGHTPGHAALVAMVLNPTMGHVSLQFHVVFDDTFSTVKYMWYVFIPPHGEELVWNSTELASIEDFDLTKTWFEGMEDLSELSPEVTLPTSPNSKQGRCHRPYTKQGR